MTNNIEVKIASKEDAADILEIQKQAYHGQAEIYNNYDLPPLTQGLESLENEFDDKTILKVLSCGRIIGVVRYAVNNGHVAIDRMAVKPEFQNQGVGTALLKEVESRVLNALSFQLFTGSKSARNIYFYKKMGYRIIGNTITDQGIELLHLEKRL